MNKRSIIGFVLIFAIFIGYMWWVSPSAEERAAMQRQHDSIQARRLDSTVKADSIKAEAARLDSLAKAGDTAAQRMLEQPSHPDMGMFNASAKGERRLMRIDNGLIEMAIDSKGAMVKEVIINGFRRII